MLLNWLFTGNSSTTGRLFWLFGLWLLFGLGRTVVGLVVKGSLLKGFNSGFTLAKFPCWLITLPGEDGYDPDSLGVVGCDGI